MQTESDRHIGKVQPIRPFFEEGARRRPSERFFDIRPFALISGD